jgi:hypothetical protein
VKAIGSVTPFGDFEGDSFVHVVVAPSKVQVSPRYLLPLKPPKSTIVCVAESNAMLAAARADGDVGGESSDHVTPSNAHVSDE